MKKLKNEKVIIIHHGFMIEHAAQTASVAMICRSDLLVQVEYALEQSNQSLCLDALFIKRHREPKGTKGTKGTKEKETKGFPAPPFVAFCFLSVLPLLALVQIMIVILVQLDRMIHVNIIIAHRPFTRPQ